MKKAVPYILATCIIITIIIIIILSNIVFNSNDKVYKMVNNKENENTLLETNLKTKNLIEDINNSISNDNRRELNIPLKDLIELAKYEEINQEIFNIIHPYSINAKKININKVKEITNEYDNYIKNSKIFLQNSIRFSQFLQNKNTSGLELANQLNQLNEDFYQKAKALNKTTTLVYDFVINYVFQKKQPETLKFEETKKMIDNLKEFTNIKTHNNFKNDINFGKLENNFDKFLTAKDKLFYEK